MRNGLVSEFASDMIGPLFGANEEIDFNPTERYIIGILAPKNSELDIEPDIESETESYDEIEVISNDGKSFVSSEDAGDNGVSISAGDDLSPVIDPRNFPKNMGISFTCSFAKSKPNFDIVVTYSKYVLMNEEKNIWKRMPRAIVVNSNQLDEGKNYLSSAYSTGELKINEIGGESAIFFASRNVKGVENERIITIMLVNNEDEEESKKHTSEQTEKLIFQPEIRIFLNDGTFFDDDVMEPDTEGEDYERFRYRGREQRARGHLCSATWGEFDPQNLDERAKEELIVKISGDTSLSSTIVKDYSTRPPFCWVDEKHPALLSYENENMPDVRTEYLPMICLPAPDMDPEGYGWSKCPSAEQLSLADSGELMKSLLEPLVNGYKNWIVSELNGAPSDIIRKAEYAEERMTNGIKMRENDEVARKAFCVANRAIYQSNKWSNDKKQKKNKNHVSRDFVWRKFQLAFALSSIESLTYPDSSSREELDLLWVATGGGKTEAYLLLMAYTVVYRRLKGVQSETKVWHGVDVITRYTLRLLTIQQSRRTLGMVTALEWLRNSGWNPSEDDYTSFSNQQISLGIWVGGSLTPNKIRDPNSKEKKTLKDVKVKVNSLSAVTLLKLGNELKEYQKSSAPEPAQIQNCPACDETLALPLVSGGNHKINKIKWVCYSEADSPTIESALGRNFSISDYKVYKHTNSIFTLCVTFTEAVTDEAKLDSIWQEIQSTIYSYSSRILLSCFRPGRPGYFPKKIREKRNFVTNDFEIHCPDPECDLNNSPWSAETPCGVEDGVNSNGNQFKVSDGWKVSNGEVGRGMPIPAYTVDEQVYRRAPSIVVATVDKFAQLPRKPESGILFGSVKSYSKTGGYSRFDSNGVHDIDSVPIPQGLMPPNLIVQDELHLIEGPLGSMVGFYETAVDELCSENPYIASYKVKYIASSATINKGKEQVSSLFNRSMNLFPPKGRNWKDRGLIKENDDEKASFRGDDKGRLFVGICPVGKTGLSTQRELFASLLHHSIKCLDSDDTPSDRYWTLVGYYNAVRELAGARTLLSFEVQQAISRLRGHRGEKVGKGYEENIRPDQGKIVELSGRMESSQLPQLLSNLELQSRRTNEATDVLLSTSMFGTGVDVDRLNAMIIAGQPKTTAQYIQAAGRVGRSEGGLILTYLRASRPRDLDHYERFIGYHAQLHKFVEAVTVRPFAQPVIEKAGGAIQLGWLRNSRRVATTSSGDEWSSQAAAHAFRSGSGKTVDIERAMDLIEKRHQKQPLERQIIQSPENFIRDSLLDPFYSIWMDYCSRAEGESTELRWSNWGRQALPQDEMRWCVFAGELQVGSLNDKAVFSNDYQTPNSLRTTDGEIQVRSRGDR